MGRGWSCGVQVSRVRQCGSGRETMWARGDFGEEAVEVGEGPGPAVAEVGGEGLEEGEGGAVGGEVEVAEVGRDVGEVGDVGEEAADFDVGIFAGALTRVELLRTWRKSLRMARSS